MHIEPGLVSPEKILLAYATASAAGAFVLAEVARDVGENGVVSWAGRALVAGSAVLFAFQILPHFPVGVSEVHFIFGAALYLILGQAAAGTGLALGLLMQGLLFQAHDLPQYAMNVTTLLVPLHAMSVLARRIVPREIALVDLSYGQALRLSATFQAGIVSWVAFWALYGAGSGAATSIVTFATAYASVLIIEPIVELSCLAIAKRFAQSGTGFLHRRLLATA